MKLGGGGRFKKLVKSLKSEGKSAKAAKGIASAVGRRKYGKKAFAKMSAKGKRTS